MLKLPWPQEPLQTESEVPKDESLASIQPAVIATVSLPTAAPPEESLRETNEPNLPAANTLPVPANLPPAVSPERSQRLPTEALQSVQPSQGTQLIQPQPVPQTAPVDLSPPPPSPTDGDTTDGDSPSPSGSPLDTEPEHGTVMVLGEGFPHLVDAQSGCYGLEGCRQLDGNYRQAAQQLVDQMEGQGYQLAERNDIDDAGHRVFEVTRADEPEKTYYLNIFSPDAGSAVYVLALDILSLEELKQLNG
ncbi:hypothetical protein [Leptolyngbya sp. BC1307]|uniref:hypothetical protein n=1 Tax=Leptolyngbya sp. BC1307 TaxID=2029589 RepID=UPI000EFAAB0F|nr:hypothetical protein [Leptolyngbya sp. BC1307]